MRLEKTILTELIHLYKDHPCLWDYRTVEYNNKHIKNKAYDILLKKYRELDENATVTDLKKRLENMRACYRRENKKILMSRMRGDIEEHQPLLWYFEHLTFLNEVYPYGKLPAHVMPSNTIAFNEVNESPPKKKRKTSTVYLEENSDDEGEGDSSGNDNDNENQYDSDQNEQNDESFDQDHENSIPIEKMFTEFVPTITSASDSEAEAFGRTVGLQLKELEETQRAIAEKLISEVIFKARFKKLTENTSLRI